MSWFSCALVSCRQTTSAFCVFSHSRKPLLAAERMPLALKLTMRMRRRIRDKNMESYKNSPRSFTLSFPPPIPDRDAALSTRIPRSGPAQERVAFRRIHAQVRPHQSVFFQRGVVRHGRIAVGSGPRVCAIGDGCETAVRHAVRSGLQRHRAGDGDGRVAGARSRPRRAGRVQPQGSQGSWRRRRCSSARR